MEHTVPGLPPLDMFALDAEVAQWEHALPPLAGTARVAVLVPLAWHLRQRDHRRAVALADEACALLPEAGLAPDQLLRAQARMALVYAGTAWMCGALDDAQLNAQAVLQQFASQPDHAGCADTHWLLAWIAVDRGDHSDSDAHFAAAVEAARLGGDTTRTMVAEAAIARWDVLRDRNLAVARWGDRFDAASAALPPAIATWTCDYLALAAIQTADYGSAAGLFIRCYESALATGQLRAAIIAATNISESFKRLNDHDAALEWVECALELARPGGWPCTLGGCLMYTADTLRGLGQLDSAHKMLREAIDILAPLESSRSYAIALQYLGDLSLDQGDYTGALAIFRRLEARADALDQSDFHSAARRGRAHALSCLGRAQEALTVAATAVAMAAGHAHPNNHIAALRVMATIHSQHSLPAPDGMAEPNAALHYLHRALAVTSSIEGYTVPGDLYDAMAREYAQAGAHARAYEFALAASAAREKTHSQHATNRAIAMQVHHQTERARNEGQHHRELAASEAHRAELLQRASDTLERLSAIGQEITGHLEAAAVFRTLDRHIHGLLDASTFAIYLTDRSGTTLHRAFGVELGQALPTNSIPLSNPQAYSVRCMAERREIYISHFPDQAYQGVVPGTACNMSALFVPLAVGERTIGVMTVQAQHSYAYDENARLIFRTLCAYGAIALDNAEAYRQLQDAQSQLLSQQRLAALGALVAGVAHELNTPIGNSLLMASTMQEKTAAIAARLEGPGLRRSELAEFIEDSRQAAALVMRGLTSAAELVNSFKQVAVDRTTEQRRSFDLAQVCREIVATMMNRVRAAGHEIDIEIGADIAMDSYPGPFGQVITNLINNALLHAYADGRRGAMRLAASMPAGGPVRIEFSDDGDGIAQQHLGRIFDPFFTTRLGQGGSGLGLSISHSIVTSLLGGQITVHSSARDGTRFVLELPPVAPRNDGAGASIY